MRRIGKARCALPISTAHSDHRKLYTRQYSVSTAERCMFIDVTTGDLGNPTGTDTEADDYLNTLEASLAGVG